MGLKKFNNVKLNLEILAEEGSEIIIEMTRMLSNVSRMKSKCIRFGLDDYHPKNGKVNRWSLAEEIGHFIAMKDILVATGIITDESVERGRLDKIKNLPEWYTFFLPDAE